MRHYAATLVILVAACCAPSSDAVAGGGGGDQASGEFWRGTKEARTCKACIYLASRIYDETGTFDVARRWPKDKQNQTKTLSEYCGFGRVKKGHPMLAFFGSIPSTNTHKDIGELFW